MPVEHVALLEIQRQLHALPRDMARFQTYLRTMLNDAGDDLELVPLVLMNPMGREHVAARLDELLALDADAAAAEAVQAAGTQLGDIEGAFRHGLVILDDVQGGWTNRSSVDANFRFGGESPAKRLWITTGWWGSETPTVERIRQAVLLSVFRLVYAQRHGAPKTLRQIMAQEGAAGVFAGLAQPYDEEELDYSHKVITPYVETTNYAIWMAALYGDAAARSLGYEPLGLSENAGFAVALADEFNR